MPVFRYVATTEAGKEFRGSVEAADRVAAERDLTLKGYRVIGMAAVSQTVAEVTGKPEPTAFQRTFVDPILFRVSARRLAWFFHELATTTNAGMSLGESLELIGRGLHPVRFRAAVQELREAVQQGRMLSTEMKRFPTIFPELAVALVRAGEQSGNMPEMFRGVAEWLEYEIGIRTKLFTATIYPKFILVVAVASVIMVVGANLVHTNPALLAAICPLVGVGAVVAWFFYKGVERWMEQFAKWREGGDRLKLAIPVIGGMFRKFAIARFARTMAATFRAGMLMDQSLEVAANACGNIAMRDRLKPVIPDVMAGGSLAEALRKTREFPETVIHMVATGERTGDLDKLLENVAHHTSEEADATAQRMIPVVFVASLLLIAVLVLIILISFWSGWLGGSNNPIGQYREMLDE